MKLDEILEAYLDGTNPTVPGELRAEFDVALRAHEALQFVLGETLIVPDVTHVDRRPPQLPSDYQIVRELGRGGMGVVYLARQQSLGREVAVKVLRPGESTYHGLVRRFMGEARHLARLKHPNVVSIHEIGEAESEPYFTMDYIAGESLAQKLGGKPLAPTQAVSILKQAAAGVQHAHEQGIIHRDLKPANILIDSHGHAYVTDFGLARDLSQASNLTRSGEIMGTPVYMAPEQARGEVALIGEATDVFALGAILYEMLTGAPPFGNSSAAEVLLRLLHHDPHSPRRIDRRIPRDLETICLKALAKSPDQRYSSVRALNEDLKRWETGEPVCAKRPSFSSYVWRHTRRHWKLMTAVVATLLITLTGVSMWGPTLFDQTTEELIAWGNQVQLEGAPAQAFDIYRRALALATPEQKPVLLDRMIRCVASMENPEQAVAAATELLQHRPNASFGKYDYLVAQSVYSQAMLRHPNLSARVATREAEDIHSMERAANRYEIVLAGTASSTAQRAAAQDRLNAIREFLTNSKQLEPQPVSQIPDKTLPKFPAGTTKQLLTALNNQTESRWNRGCTAFSLGRQSEAIGDQETAKSYYTQAWHLMHSVFPYLSGISTTTRRSRARGVEHVESPECEQLRMAAEAYRRVTSNPNAVESTDLQVQIDGLDLPEEVVLKLKIELQDTALNESIAADRHLPRLVPVKNRAAALEVATGQYRLNVGLGTISVPTDSDQSLGRRIEFDFTELPAQITLTDEPYHLAVSGWLCEPITFITPAANSTVNLQVDQFQWTRVEGAAYYRVSFVEREEIVGEGLRYSGGSTYKVETSTLCLGTLSDELQDQAEWLQPGMTATIQVDAYDAEGHRIGASSQGDFTFLVGKALTPAS
jgi:predicted Ser/Thr protein kinase